MLGKLLKHEFKSQYKIYLGMYAVILLFAGMAGFSGFLTERFENVIFTTIFVLSIVFAILSLVALFIITLILSIYRYYTNLIKDEGYLMHTLPVTPVNLHISKMIVPFVWYMIDGLILIISVSIMTRDARFEWFNFIKDIMISEGLVLNAQTYLMAAAYIFIAVISSLSLFYACLNVGSLSTSNKGVMAFVAYMGFYVVNQIMSIIGIVISFIIMIGPNGDWNTFLNSDTVPDGYFTCVFATSFILSTILIIAHNIISGYIITKKVNLE